LEAAVTFDVAFVTEALANARERANDENVMQELTKSHQNDQRRLTSVEFQTLAQVPAAVEWFANLDNPRHDVPTKMTWKTSAGLSGWLQRMSFVW
jgi:hypothetical protein